MAVRLPAVARPLAARKGHVAPRGVSQVVPEEAMIVGKRSGTIYADLSEGGQDELINIQPIEKPRVNGPKKRPGYATGGNVLIDPKFLTDYANTPEGQRELAAMAQQAQANPSQQYQWGASAPAVSGPSRASSVSPSSPTPTVTGGYGPAGTSISNATRSVQQAQQGEINAARSVLGPAQALQTATRQTTAASRAAVQAQDRALSASNAYLSEQERANRAAEAEERGIQTAAGNVSDLAAVARAQNIRNSDDPYYAMMGRAAPEEIIAPTDAVLPPGVRPKLETQEEILQREADNAGAMREFGLKTSSIASQRAGNAAQAAGNKAQMAALGQAAAQGDVNAARLLLEAAQLNTSQARLDLDISQTPPAGMVFDEFSGNFTTRTEAAISQAMNDVVKDPVNNQWVTRADLEARTNEFGHIKRASDGVNVDPKTGNEWRQAPDGEWRWHAPDGNILYGDVWVAPNGNQYRNGLWWDPQGFYMRTDGSWYNPLSGQVKYGGVIYNVNRGYMDERNAGGSLDLSGLFD